MWQRLNDPPLSPPRPADWGGRGDQGPGATVRRRVMGDDYKRVATPAEVAKMEALVDQGFKEGALCLSSGLEYEVGGYASTDEIVALAKVAAKHHAFYISHIRDEFTLTVT